MKKIFFNITCIVLAVMLLIYLLIECCMLEMDGKKGILAATADTGLPVIGYILLFPTIVLTVISMCLDKKTLSFAKDIISLFSSIFILAATIIAMCKFQMFNLYVPIIVIICASIFLIYSAISVFKAIKKDELSKKDKNDVVNEE